MAKVGQFWVSQTGQRDPFQQRFLNGLSPGHVFGQHRKIKLLGGLDVAVPGQLLDDMNGQALGPVRDARPSEVVGALPAGE